VRRLAQTLDMDRERFDWVLEGGAIDVDGPALRHDRAVPAEPEPEPGAWREEIERRLREQLGIDRLLWLGRGLLNDHTDGHVDNLARFVAEGRIASPPLPGADDPERAVYEDARAAPRRSGWRWSKSPPPAASSGMARSSPASYMNFYIGNAAVVVPLYGAPNDEAAVAACRPSFPTAGGRAAADHVLTGGGSFHCISQQVPA
jgi:agmatine deiminase